MQAGRIRLGLLLGLAVLFGGLALAWWILTQPPRIERRPVLPTPPPVVDVITTTQGSLAPSLYGFGRVEAAQQANLASRVGGQLERFTADAVPGHVIEADEPLAYIDQADLQLALEDAQAQLANAEAALALEQAEQQRARSEYQRFGQELPAERRSLVLREPQLRQAQTGVTQARVARDQAALNLERATLTAPWPAMVQARLVGAGSLLSQGTEVLQLVGIDRFWIRASLPGDWLSWLTPGDDVIVTSRGWLEGEQRQGRLLSLLPNLEENGLQAQLLIEVEDPLALSAEGPALRLGDVVRVAFMPEAQNDFISLPSAALRPGDIVWWLDDEDRLQRSSVTIAYRGEDDALISAGLDAGQRVVVSGLAQPREGQQVRVRQRGQTPAQLPVEATNQQPPTQPTPPMGEQP